MSINQSQQSITPETGGENIAAGKTAGAKAPRKLDLSRLEAPDSLEECSVEEMTIDGICGVY